MDAFSAHPLLCRFSAGRMPRHSALNDVVRHVLSAAEMPSMLGPSNLDRSDEKQPDGITVYLYSRNRCLVWDATCVNTFASSNHLPFRSWIRRRGLWSQEKRQVRCVWPTLHLPASSGRDVRHHGKIDDPIFYVFGSPIDRVISGSTREQFPVPESVFGYFQRVHLHHFAVVPWFLMESYSYVYWLYLHNVRDMLHRKWEEGKHWFTTTLYLYLVLDATH